MRVDYIYPSMQAPTTSPCRCVHSWLNMHMVGPSALGSPFGRIFDALQNFGVILYPPNNLRSPEITFKSNSNRINNWHLLFVVENLA